MEIEQCVDLLCAAVSPQKRTTKVHITKCYGMITAQDIFSRMMVPPFAKSAMDGYAVKAGELEDICDNQPKTFRVIGEMLAGDDKEISYQPGCAVRIMTGARVPDGFDAVVRQEDTNYGEDEVIIYKAVPPYQNYCKVGEDIRQGDLILAKDTRITSVHIGLLASLGLEWITVYEPAKIAIISTGTEVVDVGKQLLPGKIYNSIAYQLQAQMSAQGLEVVSMVTCADEEDLLENELNKALSIADFVITTGAVSVGKKDIIPSVIQHMGAKVLFRGANIQPGTPTMASTLDGRVMLHLSGNPYAALANFDIYFWSAMEKMMHHPGFGVQKALCKLDSPYSKVNKMRRLVRAYAKEGVVTIPSDVHASSVISNLTGCNCYIDLEAGRSVNTGDLVKVIYFKNCNF